LADELQDLRAEAVAGRVVGEAPGGRAPREDGLRKAQPFRHHGVHAVASYQDLLTHGTKLFKKTSNEDNRERASLICLSHLGSYDGVVGQVQDFHVAVLLDGDDLGGVPDGALRQLVHERVQEEVPLHAPDLVRPTDDITMIG
jgi:hypothetical protein